MKKYIKPVIGVAAFVIGGLIAREKAVDGVDTLDHFFGRQKAAAKSKTAEKTEELSSQNSQQ